MEDRLNAFLVGRFGAGKYVYGFTNPTIYLDEEAIRARGVDPSVVEAASAEFLRSYPGIFDVYTRTQLLGDGLPETPIARTALLAWNPLLSGDLYVIQRSGWFLLSDSDLAATHGSPWNYDRNVPLLLMGKGVRPGKDSSSVHIVDLAPTLTYLLGINMPAGNTGKVLPAVARR